MRQKICRTRLGHIVIRRELVSRQIIYGSLAQQLTRYMVAVIAFIIISGADIQGAHADSLPDVAGEIGLVSTANAAFSPGHKVAGLFGSRETSSSNLTPFTKWTSMYARFEADIHDAQYSRVLKKWQNDLRPLAHLPVREMAQRVNDMMNAHPYIHDDAHVWGVTDYWETPLEFLAHNGDCKDYAIAKYASLRMLGVPEDHLRIAIVQDLKKHLPHAIVLLYTDDNDTLILDNQNQRVLSSSSVFSYKPIFSINRTAWWLNRVPGTAVLALAD